MIRSAAAPQAPGGDLDGGQGSQPDLDEGERASPDHGQGNEGMGPPLSRTVHHHAFEALSSIDVHVWIIGHVQDRVAGSGLWSSTSTDTTARNTARTPAIAMNLCDPETSR